PKLATCAIFSQVFPQFIAHLPSSEEHPMPIQATDQSWILETEHTGYAFGLNAAGLLTHRYWGPRLPYAEDYPAAPNPIGWASFNNPAQLTPEEYPGYSDMKFIEPCLKVAFADGVRNVVLVFDHAEVLDGDTPQLNIYLKDNYYPFRVMLHYRVHAAHGLIERSATVENAGSDPITLERIWSAQWHFPHSGFYRLTHLSGRWLAETHLNREALKPGLKVLESRRLTTSHQ